MRTLRGLFGFLSILFSIFLFIILWFFYLLLINDIVGGGGILAGGGFALLPLLSIAPVGLIAGITAVAKRTKKVGTIVAGAFFILTGVLAMNGNHEYSDTSSLFIIVGITYVILGVLYVVSAIFQKSTTLGPKLGNTYPQNNGIQTFGPSHLPVQTYGQYQQAPVPTPAAPVENNVGNWVCPCGTINQKNAKFCTACGKPNPSLETWTCSCGATNDKDAKFCKSCGKPKQ